MAPRSWVAGSADRRAKHHLDLGPVSLGRRHERCDHIAVACSHEAPGIDRCWSGADGGQREAEPEPEKPAEPREGQILLRPRRLDVLVGAALAGPSVRIAPPLHRLSLRGCHARPDQPPSIGPVLLVQLCAAHFAYRRRPVYRATLFSPGLDGPQVRGLGDAVVAALGAAHRFAHLLAYSSGLAVRCSNMKSSPAIRSCQRPSFLSQGAQSTSMPSSTKLALLISRNCCLSNWVQCAGSQLIAGPVPILPETSLFSRWDPLLLEDDGSRVSGVSRVPSSVLDCRTVRQRSRHLVSTAGQPGHDIPDPLLHCLPAAQAEIARRLLSRPVPRWRESA